MGGYIVIHLVGLPNVDTWEFDAFRELTARFARMMTAQGFHVAHYEDDERFAGDHAPFDASAPWWAPTNARITEKIAANAQCGDCICVIGGDCQQIIVPGCLTVEWAIGYAGCWADYRVFPSYAWAHHLTGDIRFFDAVIPHFFDVADFPMGKGGEYLLYLGRLTQRKGLGVVSELAKATGLPLKVAGRGDPGLIDAPHEYLGIVSDRERAELMGGALAVLVPTTYLEPFGAVAVEAQLCGTTAITTDWGAFTETVPREYRGRTLSEFVGCVERAGSADRAAIRSRAIRRYSTETVGPQYADYFAKLATLWGDGWYTRSGALTRSP